MRKFGVRAARVGAAVVAAAVVLGLSACGAGKPDLVPSDDDAKPVVTVHAIDNAFEPKTVTVKPGQAVKWVFEGSLKHDVVAADGSFVSELVREGSYTHVFKKAGEYMYDCSIHPEMTGLVKVEK